MKRTTPILTCKTQEVAGCCCDPGEHIEQEVVCILLSRIQGTRQSRVHSTLSESRPVLLGYHPNRATFSTIKQTGEIESSQALECLRLETGSES